MDELDAVIDMILKGLVAHQDQVVLHDEPAKLFQSLPAKDRGRGVVGMGEQHHFCFVRQPLLKLPDAGLVIVPGKQWDLDRPGAQQLGV